MGYGPDRSKITLPEYKELLKQRTLLPGRRILHDAVDVNFERMERQGVRTIADLDKRLSSPGKLAAFSEESGISAEYLTILKRELGSMKQKPVPLSDFPGVDDQMIAKLSASGVKTSKDYLEYCGPTEGELSALCDLVRINGIGGIAARMFYEADCRCVADVANASAPILLAAIAQANETRRYYGAKLGEKDIQFCIDFAKLLVRYGD